MKTCTKCNEDKPLKGFRVRADNRHPWNPTRHSWCRDCERERDRRAYHEKKRFAA